MNETSNKLTCTEHGKRVVIWRTQAEEIKAAHRNDDSRCFSATFEINNRTFTAQDIVLRGYR